jgi:glyoxylase-like metal-dependent hydrolase (beta-lactamase superfamily II)
MNAWRLGMTTAVILGVALAGQQQDLPFRVNKVNTRVTILIPGRSAPPSATTVVTTPKGLLLIDTGLSPRMAEMTRRRIKQELGRDDVIRIINTHHHFDHTGGNQTYPGADIVGHERVPAGIRQFQAELSQFIAGRTARIAEQETELKATEAGSDRARSLEETIAINRILIEDLRGRWVPTPPTLTFTDSAELRTGDLDIRLWHVGLAHTDSDIIVHIPRVGVVFVGDLFQPNGLGIMSDPRSAATVARWVEVLGQVVADPATVRTVIGGHGAVTTGDWLALQHRYMKDLWTAVSTAVALGRTLPAVEADLDLKTRFGYVVPAFGLQDSRHRENIQAFWRAAAATANRTQDRPAGIQDLLRTGDVAALAAALDRDPTLVNRRDAQGVQPIFWAAVYGQPAMVELLLARGADPRSASPFGTVLHGAVAGGYPDIIKLLAAKGADVNAGGDRGVPPLIAAAGRGRLTVIQALLDAGASPGAKDSMGNTALLIAASSGFEPVVRALVSKGSDVNGANSRGTTPLDAALREGHDSVSAYLKALGAVARQQVAEPSGPLLGQTPPGMIPSLFAPALVSTERRELNAAFTPDARTFLFARDRQARGTVIMMTSFDGARWTPPAVAPFSRVGDNDVDMFVTADGREVYFCSERPVPGASSPKAGAGPTGAARWADIWVVARTGSGWGTPAWLGPVVNSDAADYYPTLTRTGTLYFSSNRQGGLGENDIYRTHRVNGEWTTPENLGRGINTESREYDPFIAPDGSYLIFASERSGGLGAADLYVSFRGAGGTWSDPENLGSAVNSPAAEYTPMLTPDGKYLFFTSSRAGQDDIYWIDARVIAGARRTLRFPLP